jgi:hypothetical protein
MRRLSIALALATGLVFLGVAVGTAQDQQRMPRKVPGTSKPECARGSICFSGQVREGETFRKELNADLDFVIGLPGGFQVTIRHADRECNRTSWVANPPFRVHKQTEIDAQYDWTAEQEIESSPRDFRFATTCAAIQRLFELHETDPGKFVADFNSLANGEGRLWITDGRATHSHGASSMEQGAVEWIKFNVEIKLPKHSTQNRHAAN